MDHDKPTPPPAVDLPPTHYASWPRRAAALLIDTLPVLTFAAAAVGLMWLTRIRACDGNPSVTDMGPQCATGVSSFGRVCFIAMWLAAVGYCVWNIAYRQGRTGSSLGKSLLRVKVVDAATGAPIGFWRSTIRQLTHLLEILTLGLGYLWTRSIRRSPTSYYRRCACPPPCAERADPFEQSSIQWDSPRRTVAGHSYPDRR